MRKRAFITGITGQDGSYLAELLLSQGFDVHGLVRRSSGRRWDRLEPFVHRLHLHEGDVLDTGSLARALGDARPDEIYHLAAQSFVGVSWRQPVVTNEVTGLGTTRLLEAVLHVCPKARVLHASSSEIFGVPDHVPLNEDSPMRPASPYGASKLMAHHMARVYRESFGMFVCNAISFNHESPRRGPEFVTRKLSLAAARASQSADARVTLGSMDTRRDWGWAPDFVRGYTMLIRHEEPLDLVFATGQDHSVRDVAEQAFAVAGQDWLEHVTVSDQEERPNDIPVLLGDASRAKEILGWEPAVSFSEIIRRMVESDIANLSRSHDHGALPHLPGQEH